MVQNVPPRVEYLLLLLLEDVVVTLVFSSDAAVSEIYSLVELGIYIGKFNFLKLGGKNGEVRFKIDGMVADFFFSSF
jgi:hypothetical protein